MAFILGVFVGVAYFLAYESDVTTLYNHLNFICFDVYFKTIFESSGTYLNSVLSKNLMFLERTSNTSFFGLELLLRPSAIYNVFMYLFLFRAIDYKSLSSLFFYKTLDPFFCAYRNCSKLLSSLSLCYVSFPRMLSFCFPVTSAPATAL